MHLVVCTGCREDVAQLIGNQIGSVDRWFEQRARHFVQNATDRLQRIGVEWRGGEYDRMRVTSGAPQRGESTMRTESNRYFTIEQLEELAVAKYIEAALMPEGGEREELLQEAKRFASRARMKSWLMGEIGITPPRREYH
ncbi:hypothetical protein RPD_0122 [Rhodopseudomonas palustris BisB5]|nr:hypothetical protein RPD_0122 [Rhodopseudomonas palustris BisB5]